MDKEQWKQFIHQAKESYKKIVAVPCPAFGGELVYFNKHGWNHLLRKGKMPRDSEDRYKRIKLFKYAEYIVRLTGDISWKIENIVNEHPAYFWTLKRYVDGIPIRIVIRKLNGGRLHFFSIMDESNKKVPKQRTLL